MTRTCGPDLEKKVSIHECMDADTQLLILSDQTFGVAEHLDDGRGHWVMRMTCGGLRI